VTTTTGFTITTPDSNIVDTDTRYVFTYTAASAASYVSFELPQSPASYVNSIARSSIACGSGSDVCLSYETGVQWVFYIPASPTTSISVTLPSGTLKNGVWVNSPTSPAPVTFKARVFDNAGNVIQKLQQSVTLSKATITVIGFDKASTETTLYLNSEHLFVVSWTSINTIPAGGSISLVFAGISQQASSDFYCLTSGLTVLSTNTVQGITCTQSSSTTILLTNLDIMTASSNIQVSLRLVTGTVNTAAIVTVSTYMDNAQTELVEQGAATEATAYSTATGLSDFYVYSNIAITGRISQVLPVVITLQPTSSTIYYIVVTFPTGFSSPSSTTSDYPYCLLGTLRVSCSYTLSPLVYTVTLMSALSGSNSLTLSTIYSNPLNGILMPTTAAYYNLQVSLEDISTNLIEQNSQYIFVAPAGLAYFDVQMAHRTYNQENLFIISIQNTLAVNPYNQATVPGRILILFPKYANDLATAAFASDLGTGLSASGIIPCSFSGLTALSGKSIQCRLIPSSSSTTKTDFATVEVINFDTVAANTAIIIRVANVVNPSTQVKDVNIRINIYQITLTTGVKTYLHQDSFDLFMNIVMTAPDSTSTYLVDYSGGSLEFASSKVYDTQKDLSLNVWTETGALNPGDFFFTYLPSTLANLPANVLPTCGSSFSYCYSFPDANLVIFEIASTIAASTATSSPVISDVFQSASQTDISFFSYVIQSGQYTHKVKHVYTAANLANLIGSISSVTFATLNVNTMQMSRKNTEVLITFTLQHQIPETGSLIIAFPSEFSNIYGGCRSYVTGTSVLTSEIGSMVGGISCNIISGTTQWFITGFAAVVTGSVIKIYGTVDLPTANTNSLTITTYGNQIGTTGPIIDQVTSGITMSGIGTTGFL